MKRDLIMSKPTYEELLYLVFFLAKRIDMLDKSDDLTLSNLEKEVIAFCVKNRMKELEKKPFNA
jgi:hypothetical protein